MGKKSESKNRERGQALLEMLGVCIGMSTLLLVIGSSIAFAAGSLCIDLCLQRAVICRGKDAAHGSCQSELRQCLGTILVAGELNEVYVGGTRHSPQVRMNWRYENRFKLHRTARLRTGWGAL